MQLSTPYVFEFQNELTCSGQISQSDVEALKKAQIKHVINLRGKQETPSPDQEKIWFDDSSIRYHHLEIAGAEDLSLDNVKALAKILQSIGQEKTLLHCGSSNRVGAMLALKAFWLEGCSQQESLSLGERAGLTALKAAVVERMQTKNV